MRRCLPIAAVVAALSFTTTADAAPGGLTPIDGPAGCIQGWSQPDDTCTPRRAFDSGTPDLVPSPDGDSHDAQGGRSIGVLRRDAGTGALSQAAGAEGCIAYQGD